jgi:serine/threonine protein kinase/tetratricopeptide (TPR) repeat protein
MVAVGEKVFGKYEVLRRLAVGGMGEIFLARQTGVIDRLVILKNLLPQLAEDDAAVASFLDEARIVGSINHPNVVALYDVGEWDGTHFHAMEFINGVDLSHLLKSCEDKRTRIPPAVSAQIIREAALGLDAAHVATDATGVPLRIVHRDISPHNLMVRADGLCKVVDFGVAVAENRSQKTEGVGLLKGKLGYMAPEQIKGAPVEPKADQFSLGVLFWEMLAQRRLFTGENAAAIFNRIIKETIPPPSSIKDDVPPELDAIVLRMTAQEPVERFARLGDAALAIRKALDQRKIADNVTAQFIRGTVGPELAARVKDLAAAAPAARATLQPTPSPSRRPTPSPARVARDGGFCGRCGTPAQPGDSFCRACGTSIAAALSGRTPSAATRVGTPVAGTLAAGRTPKSTATAPAADAALAEDAWEAATSPARLAAARPDGTSTTTAHPDVPTVSVPHLVPVPVVDVPRVDVLGAPPRTRTGAFRLEVPSSMRTPSATRVPAASPTPLAVVAGVVEQIRSGVVGEADGEARRAAWAALDAAARAAGGTLEHGDGPAFSLTFVGEHAAAAAVGVARSSVRLGARIGQDVLLRFGVAADPTASSEQAARLKTLAGELADHAAPGAAVITDAARLRAGDVATSRSATVAMRDGTSVLAHELALPRRLAGRSADLAALDGLLDEVARDGHALQLMLLGDAGIGKSVLVEAAVSFAGDRGFITSVAHGSRVVIAPGHDVVRQLVRGACSALLVRESVTGAWSRALDVLNIAGPVAARIRALVDDDGDGGLAEIPVSRRRGVLKAAVLSVFEKLVERAPLLLAVDDFERADGASLDMLAEIGARLGERRLAILVAGRPARGERVLPLARRVMLGPLSPADVVAVGTLLLGSPITGSLAQLLVERATGYPLVVVVLLRWLLARGVITVGGDGVAVRIDPARVAIPANPVQLLHDLHTSLPAEPRAVLAAAAALGRLVDAAEVARVVEGAQDVTGALRVLTDAGILEALPGERWAFRSVVELEAAAAAVEPARAWRVQARLVEFLGQQLVTRFRLDTGERLVAHLTAANALERAVECSERVAARADALGLFDVAADHWRRAFVFHGQRLVEGQPVGGDAAARLLRLSTFATASVVELEPAAAVDFVPAALARCPTNVAGPERAEAARQLAQALSRTSRLADAENVLVGALAALPPGTGDQLACSLLVDLAGVHERRGDEASAVLRAEEALRRFAAARQADAATSPERAFDALLLLARLRLRGGQPAAARDVARRALDGLRGARRPSLEVEALAIVAAAAQVEGDVPGAVRECEAALGVASAIGDPMLEARVLQQLGRALLAAGNRPLAAATLEKALVAARAGLWDEGASALQQLLASART